MTTNRTDLCERLLRFLAREEHDERRAQLDLRAMGVDDRVLEGECIAGAELVEARGDGQAVVLRVAENTSKFRVGDAVLLSDGRDLEAGSRWIYQGYDPVAGTLDLERDRFDPRGGADLEPGRTFCIDRRHIGGRGRLRDVVTSGFADSRVRSLLEGRLRSRRDAAREQRALAALASRGLNDTQARLGARAIASEDVCLIQGPPGTGKTRLLAEILAALCGRGCRIALCAFTHRAVDHALGTVRRLAPELAVFKLDRCDPDLRRAGVRPLSARRSGQLPRDGVLVGGTAYALAKLPAAQRFHFAVFDEAGQMPIPHAMAGLLLAQRWVLFGDHRQLPPVVTARHADAAVAVSIFEHLAAHYDSPMLDVTYRMNESVCRLVSDLFYEGGVRPDATAAARRLPFRSGGRFDAVLDPDAGVVLARIDHTQPGMRSVQEAELVADLVAESVRRHGVAPAEIAVVAPFRAQVRIIRTALQRRQVTGVDQIVVDTVERIQGQERDLVLLSLAVGDPDALDRRGSFFLTTNRLNVALSRARTKVVVVGSATVFAALPRDLDGLRAAAAFRRLFTAVPQVDFSTVYR